MFSRYIGEFHILLQNNKKLSIGGMHGDQLYVDRHVVLINSPDIRIRKCHREIGKLGDLLLRTNNALC